MNVARSKQAEVRHQFAQIDAMSRSELLQAWRVQCKGAVTKNLSRQFLTNALKFEAQCLIFEGHSKGLRRRFKVVAKHCESMQLDHSFDTHILGSPDDSTLDGTTPVDKGRSIVKRTQLSVTALPPPGTTLVREWNGRAYQVQVTDNGYVLDGQTYRSLSAIAFAITRTKWSGPRFFGLTGRARSPCNVKANPLTGPRP